MATKPVEVTEQKVFVKWINFHLKKRCKKKGESKNSFMFSSQLFEKQHCVLIILSVISPTAFIWVNCQVWKKKTDFVAYCTYIVSKQQNNASNNISNTPFFHHFFKCQHFVFTFSLFFDMTEILTGKTLPIKNLKGQSSKTNFASRSFALDNLTVCLKFMTNEMGMKSVRTSADSKQKKK